MHLKIVVALCPSTHQPADCTTLAWESLVYNRSNAFSAFDITCQGDSSINDHDNGDSTEVSDGDDKGGDRDEDGDSFKDNEDIYDIFLLLTCWRYVWYENQK